MNTFAAATGKAAATIITLPETVTMGHAEMDMKQEGANLFVVGLAKVTRFAPTRVETSLLQKKARARSEYLVESDAFDK